MMNDGGKHVVIQMSACICSGALWRGCSAYVSHICKLDLINGKIYFVSGNVTWCVTFKNEPIRPRKSNFERIKDNQAGISLRLTGINQKRKK